MKKITVCACLVFLFITPVFAQKTQTDERKETLKYGIDSEILELINVIAGEKTDKFDEAFVDLMGKTKNSNIKIALSKYFRTAKKNLAANLVVSFLEDYDLESEDAVIEYLEYVKEFKIRDAEDAIGNILDDIDQKLLSAAVVALGVLDSKKYFPKIWELYESDDTEDNVKSAVLRSLGESRDKDHLQFLTDILENADEKKSFRWYACEALGKIGDPSSLDLFYSVWNQNDPIMKTFILKALQNYSINDSYSVFEEALRDQNWRVRVQSIKVLGEAKYAPALEILEYKARKDPEKPVRQSAVAAIGEIGKGNDFLREYIKDTKMTEELRISAVNILGENDFKNSAADFRELIRKVWDKEKSKLLDTLCKQFSLYPINGYDELFEAMLKHKSVNLKIYAIRGIGLNKITGLKSEVEAFTTDRNSSSMKRIANDALEKF